MRIENDVKLDFSNVMIRPKRSTLASRKDVSLERTYKFKHAGCTKTSIPIIVSNMDHTGTIEMAEALTKHKLHVALHKFYPRETVVGYLATDNRNHHVWYTIGAKAMDLTTAIWVHERLQAVGKKTLGNALYGIEYLCIDVANGYTEDFTNFVRKARGLFPTTVIMAGNVATHEMTEELILSGADIVKVGIGDGSVCTTRKVAGVGYPQLSAIIECADAAHGLGGLICGDGGIQSPGDLGKAFGAGADFVMCGGVFAGHAECAGEKIGGDKKMIPGVHQLPTRDDHELAVYKFLHPNGMVHAVSNVADLPDEYFDITDPLMMKFHGMSSTEAMEEHYGGLENYRAAEGKEVTVPYKGAVDNTAIELLGGLRSTCTYVGAKNLKELSKRTTFIRVTQQLNPMFGG